MLDAVYKPSKWGDTYHRLRTDEALGAGAAGPGKSMVLLMNPIQQVMIEHARCLKDPRGVAQKGSWLWNLILENPLRWSQSTGWALHLRRTTPMLAQTIQRSLRIFPQIDPGAQFQVQTSTWVFPSGYRYQFTHCSDRDTWQNYMSNEYTEIDWDELTQFIEEQYDQVNTRLRSTDPVLRHFLRIRAMSNPMMSSEDGITVDDPFWVRRRFVDPCKAGKKVITRPFRMPDGTVRKRTSIYLPATIDDNPNKIFVEQYKANLASAKPHIRLALLYGDWYFVPGAYYSDAWNTRMHVIRPFQVPGYWKFFRSMDWGFKKRGVIHWWTMDPDGNIYCIKEYTFKLKTVDQVAEDVKDIEISLKLWDERAERSRITGPSDTQLWEQRGDIGKSKAMEFAERGINWTKADKKSRQRNAERLSSRLADHNDGTTLPGIMFFDTCSGAIQTIPTIPSDKNAPEVPADGNDDDWHDSVLYACAFASHGSAGVPSMAEEEDEWEEDRRKEKRRAGRYAYGNPLC
jgi:hypothetical protein